MALGLHPNAKLAAISSLAERLPNVSVKSGMLLDSFSAFLASIQADAALPKTGKIYDRMVDFVDELPLVEFAVEQIRRELSESSLISYDDSAPPKSLTEIPGFEDPEATAIRLVELFESLPWKYSFSIEFPNKIVPDELFQNGALALGADGRLVKPDLIFASEYPLFHDNPKIDARVQKPGALGALLGRPSWGNEATCYQQEAEGYVSMYGGGSVVSAVEMALASFIGLGLATKLFSYDYKYQNRGKKSDWMVHISRDEGWEFSTRIEVDEEISAVLAHVFEFKFEQTYPEEHRGDWLLSVVSNADKLKSSVRSGTLLLATKWFFDSFKGSDQTLKYIRLMTTLEILLGEHADTSRASLGEILGNRLAYLIGKNHQDRSDILSEFKKIYGVRSGILHHGKHKLRGDERNYIVKLRGFCERAIEEEARLLLAC